MLIRWSDRASELRSRLPLLTLAIRESSRIDLVDRCLAIGAQGLLALLPFLVVLSAWAPMEFGNFIITRLRDTVGLDSTAAATLRQLVVSQGPASIQTGIVGLIVALISATSFSRVLQRMYVKVFDLGDERRPGRIKLSVTWLAAWLIHVAVLAGISQWGPGAIVTGALLLTVQVFFWWWTAHAMLLGGRSWLEVLPVALFTTAGLLVLVHASNYAMPPYTRTSIHQFGGFGAVIALATWLVALAGVVVVGALAGRLAAEHPMWRTMVARTLRVELTPRPQG